jgi:hypothetical protein
MKKIVLPLVLFAFLFACSTAYLFVMNNKNAIQLHYYEGIENVQIPEIIHNKDLQYITALSTEGKLFHPTMVDVINQNGIEQATHGVSSKLIFYYSELNCNSCVEIIIKEIENFRDSIGSDNIVYLSDYKRIRDMQIFKRINHISSEIYNISSLNIPLEKMHVPLLFVLDNDKRIRSVFIPNKEDIKTIKLYLSTIKMKHFD